MCFVAGGKLAAEGQGFTKTCDYAKPVSIRSRKAGQDKNMSYYADVYCSQCKVE